MMIPQLTPGELRALKRAARHTHRTPREDRVEHHPQTRQYARALFDAGLLCTASLQGRRETLELSIRGLKVLHAYWVGAARTGPRDGPIEGCQTP
jgi:hypothetical protein